MADGIDLKSASYVFGVLSIVFAFFSPFAGLVLGIVGYVQGKRSGGSRGKKLSVIGIVLSIVFLVLSIIAVIYSVKTGVSNFFPSV